MHVPRQWRSHPATGIPPPECQTVDVITVFNYDFQIGSHLAVYDSNRGDDQESTVSTLVDT